MVPSLEFFTAEPGITEYSGHTPAEVPKVLIGNPLGAGEPLFRSALGSALAAAITEERCLSVACISFQEQPFAGGKWADSAMAVRDAAITLRAGIRGTDTLAILNETRLGLIFPGTPEAGLLVVLTRVLGDLEHLRSEDPRLGALTSRAVGVTTSGTDVGAQTILMQLYGLLSSAEQTGADASELIRVQGKPGSSSRP